MAEKEILKVSFITGVYNSEKYIAKCVESMLNQTYKNFEIILVVNASVDDSEKIVKGLENDYPDIIKGFYYKEKLGAGGSRGVGLQYATGDYIAYVDNDDILEKNYLSSMVNALHESKDTVDIVSCNFCKMSEDESRILYHRKFRNRNEALVQGVAPWAKMYRRQFLLDNNLIPRNVPFGEDVIFTSDVILSSPRYVHVENEGYKWRDNLSSTSHTELRGFPKDTFEISSHYFDEMYDKYYTDNPYEYTYLVFKYYMWYLLNSGRGVASGIIKEEYRKIEYYLNKKEVSWKSLGFKSNYLSGERAVVLVVLFMIKVFANCKLAEKFFGSYSGSILGKLWPSL